MPEANTFVVGGGSEAVEALPELAAVYELVYSEPHYSSGALIRPDAFRTRTQGQAVREGFSIVMARSSEGDLTGFSFGFTFAEGRWWSGETTPPPPDLLADPKFAVIELVLLPQWRGNGIGHQLLNRLLSDRPEPIATLCALPDAPVRMLYDRRGWIQLGQSYLSAEELTLDVLVLSLPQRTL